MSAVLLVDTSVFCNVLDIPGKNQNVNNIRDELRKHLIEQCHLLLPLAVIFETGNHIGQISNGQIRRFVASSFKDQVEMAFSGNAPWSPIAIPERKEILECVQKFPEVALRGLGMGDASIIEDWQKTCNLNRGRRVRIWSLDRHLASYDRGSTI